MRTIALISQKGGAGKTTLAIALAVTAERAGLTSVLVDLDPQGRWRLASICSTSTLRPTPIALAVVWVLRRPPSLCISESSTSTPSQPDCPHLKSAPSGKAATEINELFNWTRSRDQW